MKAYEYIISQLDEYQNVHYFGAVKKQLDNLAKRTTSLDSTLNESVLLRERVLFFQGGLITALSILGTGYFYLKDPLNEHMTLDDFIWATLYLSLISPSLETLSQTVNKLIADYQIFHEATEYMRSAKEKEINDQQLRVNPSNATIAFNDLTFRYIDNQVILDGLSFSGSCWQDCSDHRIKRRR
jgi:ABC-type multidrug transport system fused ATPase/permease subunit